MYKQLIQLKNQKANNPIKMSKGPEPTFFQRPTTANCTCKGAQYHEPSRNANQNHNEISLSHLSEWLLSKRQEMTNGKTVA